MATKSNAGRRPKPAVKIAIDAGSISAPPHNQGGVARICQTLVSQLPRLDRHNKYIIYSFKKLDLDLPPNSQSRVKVRILPKNGFSRVWLPLMFILERPDVFLAISQYLPSGSPDALGFIYDLAFLQERFKKMSRRGLKSATDTLISRSKHLLTFSDFTKKAVVKKYKTDPFKISVISPGVNIRFLSPGVKLISDTPYFLYVGALKPSKNLPMMLRAFAAFLKETNSNFKLIIVGEISKSKLIKQIISELSLTNFVTMTGYVSDEQLTKYYRGAYAFVSPALLEGFGFPILEAMASGTPVIAGNNSAMKEVVGKSGLLVDARSNIEIAAAMRKLITDFALYNKLSRLGRNTARRFNEQKFAKKVLQIINKKVL